MNVLDAAYDTVHEYPGGAGPLATRLTRINKDGERVSMSEAVLNSKVDPNKNSHHLTLVEADRIMGLTGDHRILHVMAAGHGYALVPLGDVPQVDLVTLLLTIAADKGELSAEFAKAYSDKVITPNERDRMNAIVFRLIARFARFAQQANAAVAGQRVAA